MGKWKIPDEEQARVLRSVGIDPAGVVVTPLGDDCFNAMEMLTRSEFYFRDGKLREATDKLGQSLEWPGVSGC